MTFSPCGILQSFSEFSSFHFSSRCEENKNQPDGFSTMAQRRHSVLNVLIGRSVPASVQTAFVHVVSSFSSLCVVQMSNIYSLKCVEKMYCNRIFDFMSWSLKQVYFTVLYKSATPMFVKENYFCFCIRSQKNLGSSGCFLLKNANKL